MSKKKQPKITKAKEPEIRYKATIPSDDFIAQLSPVLFWDTDISQIDPKKHASYIIERVASLGTLFEWEQILSHYGEIEVKETVCRLRTLDPKTLNFLSFFFNIPKEQFRCYTNQQSFPTHYPY
ncbi:MAG: hypothetical protein M3Q58_11455 [Bacteroidota bacterium]|nr:hypothetical protein [Bacteroidota bacterium]